MRQVGFGSLVTAGPNGPEASHIPMFLDPEPAPFGTLRAHVARANGQAREFEPGMPALAIFTGPHHYISPSWYPSKTEHGRVVPTWNYVVVHARGPLQVIHDPHWLKRNVSELTAAHEAGFANPWKVSDAPADFIDNLVNAIVGIEIPIATLEGKCKASQNRPEADRLGVIAGLRELKTPEADRMAEIVAEADRRAR